jgi:hypothetical protein
MLIDNSSLLGSPIAQKRREGHNNAPGKTREGHDFSRATRVNVQRGFSHWGFAFAVTTPGPTPRVPANPRQLLHRLKAVQDDAVQKGLASEPARSPPTVHARLLIPLRLT